MTWATFYLVCFVVGLSFCFLSLLTGLGRLHIGHFHLPHGHHIGAHHGGASGARVGGGPLHISFFNFFSLMAFLAWFGGTGFLLEKYSSIWFLLALLIATVVGMLGALIVFWFLAKVLIAHDTSLDPADYELVGVLGRVSSGIREGGTGEITFSQAGTRRVSGARSEDGTAIGKGSEIVVTKYEHGIAYVRRWDDLTQ
jgi:membrane protein implicated in regulation of membrane protease activity